MTRVGVVGATGYTGAELVRLLSRHPQVTIAALTAERNVGQPLWKLFPSLLKESSLVCQPLEVEPLSAACDFVFTALPHKAAMEVVPGFLERGLKVVDLSADFRLTDPQVYEKWYEPHTAPTLLKEAVYGIPELHREEIRKARLVANPGCYPTIRDSGPGSRPEAPAPRPSELDRRLEVGGERGRPVRGPFFHVCRGQRKFQGL